MTTPADFDVSAPLPVGRRVLLEASAGTGKTFSLTSLVARYVAEHDLAVSELLMVTFTKAAASELRERTRSKLARALEALERHLTEHDLGGDGPWLRPIVDCTPEERAVRIDRLRVALSEVDGAVITTIHGFFQQTLREVGLRSSDMASAEIDHDTTALARQAVRDALIASYAQGDMVLAEALAGKTPSDVEHGIHEILKVLRSNISAVVAPEDSSDHVAREWARVVRGLVEEIARRRQATGRLSFDDLVLRLRDIVRPGHPLADDVIASLRSRFRLVLIDEFQDTDDAQWEVFSSIFDVAEIAEHQARTPVTRPFLAMILVGDPKQAIYRFRGADITAYLTAIDDPDLVTYQMRHNFRSDPALIQALNHLFGAPPGQPIAPRGFRFGSEHIAYVQVEAARADHAGGLSVAGEPDRAKALQLSFVVPEPGDKPAVADLRSSIAEDLANHIVLLLDDGTIEEEVNGALSSRRVRPRDLCILIRVHSDAEPLVEALRARSIPVVKSKIGQVTDSPAAQQLRTLLTALANPSDSRRVRAAALSWFVGSSIDDLLDDTKVVDLAGRCHEWAKVLVDRGIVGLFQELRSDPDVITRLSAAPDAERRLTDLEHLIELLHRRLGPARPPAASVLRQLEELLSDPQEHDERVRRIDSDAEAIEITTVHSSKGLEYPVVFVPFPKYPNVDSVSSYTIDGQRYVDGAPRVEWVEDGLDQATRKQLTYREFEADELRLMYVAFTRAKHQLLVWWANSRGMNKSPLARLLFGDHHDLGIATKVPDGDALRTRFGEIAQHLGDDVVNLREIPASGVEVRTRRDSTTTPPGEGTTCAFPGHATGRWWYRRWSFSSLASGLDDDQDHHAGGSDEGDGDTDGATVPDDVSDAATDVAGSYERRGLFLMPASAAFGILVHELLEVVDFTSPTLHQDLLDALQTYGAAALRGIDTAELAAGLVAALHTPLDGLMSGRRLVDLPARDRLAEMSFTLSLGSSDQASSARAIALAAASDPGSAFREYFVALADRWGSERDQAIGGLLTGSIDAVLRAQQGPDWRYVVVDYKSNRLSFARNTLDHRAYGHDSMRQAMESHHYPLQALLYCVALHRFLQGRMEDYDIDRHLGGAGYLFLRGMVGEGTPRDAQSVNGVFSWRPSSEVILKVDQITRGQS